MWIYKQEIACWIYISYVLTSSFVLSHWCDCILMPVALFSLEMNKIVNSMELVYMHKHNSIRDIIQKYLNYCIYLLC